MFDARDKRFQEGRQEDLRRHRADREALFVGSAASCGFADGRARGGDLRPVRVGAGGRQRAGVGRRAVLHAICRVRGVGLRHDAGGIALAVHVLAVGRAVRVVVEAVRAVLCQRYTRTLDNASDQDGLRVEHHSEGRSITLAVAVGVDIEHEGQDLADVADAEVEGRVHLADGGHDARARDGSVEQAVFKTEERSVLMDHVGAERDVVEHCRQAPFVALGLEGRQRVGEVVVAAACQELAAQHTCLHGHDQRMTRAVEGVALREECAGLVAVGDGCISHKLEGLPVVPIARSLHDQVKVLGAKQVEGLLAGVGLGHLVCELHCEEQRVVEAGGARDRREALVWERGRRVAVSVGGGAGRAAKGLRRIHAAHPQAQLLGLELLGCRLARREGLRHRPAGLQHRLVRGNAREHIVDALLRGKVTGVEALPRRLLDALGYGLKEL